MRLRRQSILKTNAVDLPDRQVVPCKLLLIAREMQAQLP